MAAIKWTRSDAGISLLPYGKVMEAGLGQKKVIKQPKRLPISYYLTTNTGHGA